MKILGVIPARFASTRFPGKPLTDIDGWPMIRHVYERAKGSASLTGIIVATDHPDIFDAVQHFGGNVIMTSDKHPTGTDRIIEVMEKMPEYDGYINIQGDEPKIHSEQIDQVSSLMRDQQGLFVATLVKKTRDIQQCHSPNVVKVVFDVDGRALYFSRFAVPFLREVSVAKTWVEENGYWKHIGIYGYSRAALQKIKTLKQGKLELAESLEQLRWLENGIPVFVGETELESIAIDTPEDLKKLN